MTCIKPVFTVKCGFDKIFPLFVRQLPRSSTHRSPVYLLPKYKNKKLDNVMYNVSLSA